MTATRRLAAILAADVAGYSRLIGSDEEGTLNRLKVIRAEVIDSKITQHRGRLVKTTGDGFLVEFVSVVDAVRCAVEWQRDMAERNVGKSDDRIEFRMGIHQGDIVVEGDDILGDGVNVAARLEGLADPGGICVSAPVQEDAAGRLDLTFDDLGEQSLKNIARPVRVCRVRLATTVSTPKPATVEGEPTLALPDKPSIAVLPFQNMSGDPEQEYFADGMVEEIITALSRIRWLFVIARNSTFTYKGQAIDVKRVGRELGVRYVLEGSVRKGGNRVRITGQLVDALSGAHLWADRFDGLLEDVFELQDKVALSVAGIIEPALQAAESRRSANRQTNDLTAYDLYLRAIALFYPVTKERLVTALGLLEQAIAIDPSYGAALSWAAVCHLRLISDGWAERPETNRRECIDLSRRALQVGDDDPGVLANTAITLAQLGEDIGAMMGLIDRALVLNPSFARGWFRSGLIRIYAGQLDLAIEHLETSLRLSPRERVGAPLQWIGMAHFFKRQFDEAAAKLLSSIQENPGSPTPYRALAACYAHMGRLDEARSTIAKMRALTSLVMPINLPYRVPEHRELLLSGLRFAVGEST
jgi:TolB-like protein/class 3 adenylate cyclase